MKTSAVKTALLKMWVNETSRKVILEYRLSHGIPAEGFKTIDVYDAWSRKSLQDISARQRLAAKALNELRKKMTPEEARQMFFQFVEYPIPVLKYSEVFSIWAEPLTNGKQKTLGAKIHLSKGVTKTELIKFIQNEWGDIEEFVGKPKKYLKKRPYTIDHFLYYKIYEMRSKGITSKEISEKLRLSERAVQDIWQRQIKKWINGPIR